MRSLSILQLASTKIVAKSEKFSEDYSWLLRHSFFDTNDKLADSEFAPEEYSVFYSHKPDKLKAGVCFLTSKNKD